MRVQSGRWPRGMALLSIAVLGTSLFAAQPQLPAPRADDDQAQGPGEVLTRGPVHEAFAEPVTYDVQEQEPLIVNDRPPEPINEVAPEVKPADDAEWIPGYFAWDGDENRFLWVSGLWRVPPSGHRWVPGYWSQVNDGYLWVPGTWVTEETEELRYLPEPPTTIEAGPNQPAPSESHFWVPGCWMWQEADYAWRPGYWLEIQPEWVWVPAHYVWTPYGCVFVAGYWDLLPEERGLMFAPVYFEPTVIQQVVYRPQVVINVDVLMTHLFVHARRGQYFFGDYYDGRFAGRGIHPWVHVHSRRGVFDPLFVHRRWEHRNDRDWVRTLERSFEERRDREELRPPRTFARQREFLARASNDPDRRDIVRTVALATPAVALLGGNRAERGPDRERAPRISVVRVDDAERERVTRQVTAMRNLQTARRDHDRQLPRSDGPRRTTAPDRRGPGQDADSRRPGADRPGNDRPGADRPGADRPGADRPGNDRPGADRPGADRPGNDRPGAERPGADRPGADRPGADRPGADRPGADRPGADRPSNANRSGFRLPGAGPRGNAPRPDQPGSQTPGGDRPRNVTPRPEGRARPALPEGEIRVPRDNGSRNNSPRPNTPRDNTPRGNSRERPAEQPKINVPNPMPREREPRQPRVDPRPDRPMPAPKPDNPPKAERPPRPEKPPKEAAPAPQPQKPPRPEPKNDEPKEPKEQKPKKERDK